MIILFMKFQTKKSLGQHFLNSPVVPGWMCEAADLKAGETVVEIGPGTGVLTEALLSKGVRVLALEADERAVRVLEEKFREASEAGLLTVHHLDVKKLDWSTLGLKSGSYKIVANIPYYLSGWLFRNCLSLPVKPERLVFLVQKEVARRATATLSKGEKESLLSLSIKAFGEPSFVRGVPRGHFSPPPKVDSGIVLVKNISGDNFKKLDQVLFFKVLRLGFGQKRKQLLGNLAQQFDRQSLTHIFSTLSLPISVRAEDVPLKDWLNLVQHLYNLK